MSWWINKVNNLVSYKSNYLSAEELVDQIYKDAEKRRPKITPPEIYRLTEPNEPNEPADLTRTKERCPVVTDQNSLSTWKDYDLDKNEPE
jgi:hypothetical protein